MNFKMLKLIPAVTLALMFAGCSSVPETGGVDTAEGGAEGAPVVEADTGSTGAAGAMGATESIVWTGHPLDDPNSLLSTRVIYFDYDISEIRADFHDVVTAHGGYLATNPDIKVTVEGHCDERGSREYNIALGERRANAVKRLLLSQRAAERQIITISYGEERPADMGSHEAAWAKNRRVELTY